MNKMLSIRKRLGLSQKELANRIGKSQGVISLVELGHQDLMPDDARRVISVAASEGVSITFDDLYELPTAATTAAVHTPEAQKTQEAA